MIDESEFLRMLKFGLIKLREKEPKIEWVQNMEKDLDNGYKWIGETLDGYSVCLHKETGKIVELNLN